MATSIVPPTAASKFEFRLNPGQSLTIETSITYGIVSYLALTTGSRPQVRSVHFITNYNNSSAYSSDIVISASQSITVDQSTGKTVITNTNTQFPANVVLLEVLNTNNGAVFTISE